MDHYLLILYYVNKVNFNLHALPFLLGIASNLDLSLMPIFPGLIKLGPLLFLEFLEVLDSLQALDLVGTPSSIG